MSVSAQGRLNNSINGAGEGLGVLMRSLRKRSDSARQSRDERKRKAAETLYNEAVLVAQKRLRLKIQEIESSEELKSLLKDFKEINKSLKSEAKQITDLNKNITSARKFIANLDSLLTEAIVLAG